MASIQTIEKQTKVPRKLNVCAYARVSCDKDTMLHSLFNQVNYYSRYIQSNPGWNYVGVYSDAGKTGTKGSRGDFEQMFNDANEGKIDIILVKSITRFARNTEITLKWVRAMKDINVDIFFESEGIHTLSSDGEMLITLFAGAAQEQSRTCSLNTLWRVKRNFEQGISYGGKDCLGYKLKMHTFTIVSEEAELVKRIYNLYLEGNGDCKIAKILNNEGLKSKTGVLWQKNAIRTILTNYNYTGNLMLQKTYRIDYLSKLTRVNKGEKDMYLVEDNHEAIISLETFEKAQELRKARFNRARKESEKHSFTGIVVCGNCGKNYKYKKTNGKGKYECVTYNDLGKAYCLSKAVPEETLMLEITYLLKIPTFDETKMRAKIKKIIVKENNMLEVHFVNGKVEVIIWKDRSRSESWTPEMREKARQRNLQKGGKE